MQRLNFYDRSGVKRVLEKIIKSTPRFLSGVKNNTWNLFFCWPLWPLNLVGLRLLLLDDSFSSGVMVLILSLFPLLLSWFLDRPYPDLGHQTGGSARSSLTDTGQRSQRESGYPSKYIPSFEKRQRRHTHSPDPTGRERWDSSPYQLRQYVPRGPTAQNLNKIVQSIPGFESSPGTSHETRAYLNEIQ